MLRPREIAWSDSVSKSRPLTFGSKRRRGVLGLAATVKLCGPPKRQWRAAELHRFEVRVCVSRPPFPATGRATVERALKGLGATEVTQRMRDGAAFLTDDGNPYLHAVFPVAILVRA